jgi:dihydrofolate synthase/folylpolyglutamate synthase
MKLSTMQDWLAYIGSVHQQEIELGLERVKAVAERLSILKTNAAVVVVGGTNGKGSTVAALNAIYREAGYQVGVFTTPFLFKHNEEVMVNGVFASDEDFCQAFEAIEAVRAEITLTPFEYHTLAALCIFKKHPLAILLLEVGMGGRLDAVNIMDADVAVITSIALDHEAWLGNTREAIATEKAGIMRKDRPVVIAEPSPPANLQALVKAHGALAFWLGVDYHAQPMKGIKLYENNLATAAMVVKLLQTRLAVSEAAIQAGLMKADLTGRQQVIHGEVTHYLDVAHNPHAIRLLYDRLSAKEGRGKTIAVFSMLGDKDIVASLQCIASAIDHWCVAPLENKRGASEQQLVAAFKTAGITGVSFSKTIAAAYHAARAKARPGDRIVIFGSFVTVAAVMGLVQP